MRTLCDFDVVKLISSTAMRQLQVMFGKSETEATLASLGSIT